MPFVLSCAFRAVVLFVLLCVLFVLVVRALSGASALGYFGFNDVIVCMDCKNCDFNIYQSFLVAAAEQNGGGVLFLWL